VKKKISGYKKREVFYEFEKALQKHKLHHALYWGTELHASGFFEFLWKKIFIFHSQYIHIQSPGLSDLIFSRYLKYMDIKKRLLTSNKLSLRNNFALRHDLYQIIYYLTLLPKKNINYCIPRTYFNKKENSKIISHQNPNNKNFYIINDLLGECESDDIINAINEIKYHMSVIIHKNNKNEKNKIFYWLGYILEYGIEISEIVPTPYMIKIYHTNSTKKTYYYMELIWNLLMNCSLSKNNINMFNTIKILYQMYKFEKNFKYKYYHIIHSFLFFFHPIKYWNIKTSLNTFIDVNQYYKNIQISIHTKHIRNDYIPIKSNYIKTIHSTLPPYMLIYSKKKKKKKEKKEEIQEENIEISIEKKYKRKKKNKKEFIIILDE